MTVKFHPLKIEPLPAFRDNYIWLLSRHGCKQVAVVDPGEAGVVCTRLQGEQMELETILITHHHSDHTGGIHELLSQYPGVNIYGPANERIPGVRFPLDEGACVEIEGLGVSLQILEVPGHTAGHIAYYLHDDEYPAVFCGDTLFSVGCGRLFEGTAEQLYDSLCKLSALPGNTRVFCAHEYTSNNIEFALEVTPDNQALQGHARQVRHQRKHGQPSLPSLIGLERGINPFLRVGSFDVIASVESMAGCRLNTPEQVFAQLRKWKDRY